MGAKRVTNLTKDILAATARTKQAQMEKNSTPQGKQKAKSDRGLEEVNKDMHTLWNITSEVKQNE